MSNIDTNTTKKISYGLFVLTANTNKQNGCIINTAIQVTSEPYQISIAVNKSNYTAQMILESKEFNISVLSQNAKFDVFTRFGFQSGRDVDKFDGFSCPKAENGIYYIDSPICNAFMSVKVKSVVELSTHYVFIGEVSEAKVLSDAKSATYEYYFEHIKPKKQAPQEPKKAKVYVCQICGYEYDESREKVPFDELPDSWTCPLCTHPKSDFELQ